MISAKKLFARTQQHLMRAIDYNRNDLIAHGWDVPTSSRSISLWLLGAVAASESVLLGRSDEACGGLLQKLHAVVEEFRVVNAGNPYAMNDQGNYDTTS